MANAPLRAAFGPYDLAAGMVGGRALARAFLRGAPQGSGVVAEAEGPTREAALAALRDLLERRGAEAARNRRPFPGHPGSHVPNPQEFREALLRVRPDKAQWAMLRGHAAAGAAGMTAGELAAAGGYADFETANLRYGLLGQAVAEAIGMPIPESRARPGKAVPTFALAFEGEARAGTDRWVWVMHPELAEALADLERA